MPLKSTHQSQQCYSHKLAFQDHCSEFQMTKRWNLVKIGAQLLYWGQRLDAKVMCTLRQLVQPPLNDVSIAFDKSTSVFFWKIIVHLTSWGPSANFSKNSLLISKALLRFQFFKKIVTTLKCYLLRHLLCLRVAGAVKHLNKNAILR